VREPSSDDKGTDTNPDVKVNIANPTGGYKNTQSTSTDDLLSGFHMGHYSKNQLLSSHSLFNKKSTLTNTYASITPAITASGAQDAHKCVLKSVPAIEIKNNELAVQSKSKHHSSNKPHRSGKTSHYSGAENANGNNSNKFTSVYKLVSNDGRSGEYVRQFQESFRLLTSDLQNSNLIKLAPKKSNEWTLFKNNQNSSDGSGSSTPSRMKPLSVITTTLTTTTISKIRTTTHKNDIEERTIVTENGNTGGGTSLAIVPN
jgi:hypothetical protein